MGTQTVDAQVEEDVTTAEEVEAEVTEESTNSADDVISEADKPDAVRALIESERAAKKEAADKAAELLASNEELAAKVTDTQAKNDELASELQAATQKLLRYEVAIKHGIPADQSHRLQGATPEELDADAATFKAALPDPAATFDRGVRAASKAFNPNELIQDSVRGTG